MSKSTKSKPRVSIIVVNYNGQQLMDDCLGSLKELKFPHKNYEVIVVDNNSHDSSAVLIKKKYSWVKLIESDKNLGFTGGNNLGLKHASGEYIVLLNSDTKVDKNWLKELVSVADNHPRAGLITSKLLFATPYLELTIKSKTIASNEIDQGNDFSPMGVLMEDIRYRNNSLENLIWYQSGFYLKKESNLVTRWTNGHASVLLPFANDTEEYIFKLHGYPQNKQTNLVKLILGNEILEEVNLKPFQVKEVRVNLEKKRVKKQLIWLVQNAGNQILHDGYGKDVGSILRIEGAERQEFYEKDNSYFNQQKKVSAVCGASLLIKRSLIEELEMLDGHYYMYYEDLDLSLRAWRAGYDLLYAPKSIVYHKHRASTGKKITPFFLEMIERNHLFFITTHFPLTTVVIELFKLFARTLINWSLTVALKFSQNIYQYHLWQGRFEARRQALTTYLMHLPRLLKNRHFWQKVQKRDINLLIKGLC